MRREKGVRRDQRQMYADKWHLTINLDYDITKPVDHPTNMLYEFAYAYPPRTTRGDCTNRLVHGHPRLKNGRMIKPDEAMHIGTSYYV